ncbi:rhomboid family intramembrane serine protease [Bacillus solitudinis]|uniref:rhomboid family intramembrane serine protease n=1 Tax=Bacillus solitudinis TaxID=2014074 RepID=UPI000C247E6D|nr:rhomboid family intramembrane serine protease [Bacillus solitudinis]
MEVLRHDNYFWQLVHFFVVERDFRVHDIREKEVWLEEEDSKPRRIIRIVRSDIDWANWLKKDIVESARKFELVRRQLRLKNMVAENIYVSIYPPVDSWEHLQKPMVVGKKHNITVHTTLLFQEEVARKQALMTRLGTYYIPDFQIESDVDQIELKTLNLRQVVRQKAEQKETFERSLFTYGKPIATFSFLLLIAIAFYQLERSGGSTSILTLIEFGAKYNPLILEGEWWRFISAMFLHIGLLHVVMNSLALFYLGSAVERIYGTSRFLVIYFLAGILGSISSFAFNEQVAAGASGAIFGCFGALLYFGTIHRKLFFRTMGRNLIIILALNLIFGFSLPMIDNGAHLGGLVGGFLASALVHLPKHRRQIRQLGAFILITFLGGGLYLFGITNEHKVTSDVLPVQIAQEYLQQDAVDKAYPFLVKAVEQGTELPEAYFLLAYAEADFENFQEAKTHLLKTIELRPTFHEAHYNLALVYVELGSYEEALASVSQALELAPDEEIYSQLKDQIETF